jgi:hypothetical protein
VSGNGRFVSFWSYADNLVPGDPNTSPDVFVRDLLTGAIECATRASGGALSNGPSADPFLSADGSSFPQGDRHWTFVQR